MLEKLSKSGVPLLNVLKLLRETALDQMSAKTFEHLKRKALQCENSFEMTCEVYEAKLYCGLFARDEDTWIEYYAYLKGMKRHLEARRILERALEKVNDKQKIIVNCQ